MLLQKCTMRTKLDIYVFFSIANLFKETIIVTFY